MSDEIGPNRQRYDEYWNRFTPATPPADPSGTHHDRYRHWPVFDALCEAAATRKVSVSLVTSKSLVTVATGKERRNLAEIRLLIADHEFAAAPITEGDLDATADILRPLLIAGQIESD